MCASIGDSAAAPTVQSWLLPFACPALRAICLRFAGLSFAARALPPARAISTRRAFVSDFARAFPPLLRISVKEFSASIRVFHCFFTEVMVLLVCFLCKKVLTESKKRPYYRIVNKVFGIGHQQIYQGSKPVRDPEYRRFIRSLPCAACGKSRFIDCAHTGPHGLGQKASDLDCIGLCARSCHHEFDADPRGFAVKYKIDIPAVIRKLNAFWFEKLNGGAA